MRHGSCTDIALDSDIAAAVECVDPTHGVVLLVEIFAAHVQEQLT
jgi:hypothetical protein